MGKGSVASRGQKAQIQRKQDYKKQPQPEVWHGQAQQGYDHGNIVPPRPLVNR